MNAEVLCRILSILAHDELQICGVVVRNFLCLLVFRGCVVASQ
jgi:hypothetical protein